MKNISNRLVRARKTSGYTQKKLSELLAIAESTMNYWETGKRKIDAETVAKIAQITGCNAGWLLTGEGSMEAVSEQKTKIEGVQKSEEREIFEQTLYNYLDLILEKGDDDKRFDRIINDIWHLGEKLSNASEKESRIKRAIKKAIGG